MNLQLSLRQNGNNLNGSITNPFGSGTLPIRGSVSGNYITFTAQQQNGGYNNQQLQFSGAIDQDRMQGNATIPANNNSSYGGGYPGGGYPGGGYPGGGYPGGGGGNRRRPSGGGTVQVHWNAQRN